MLETWPSSPTGTRTCSPRWLQCDLCSPGSHQGRDWLEAALDVERRELIRANERSLSAYLEAAEEWEQAWPRIGRAIEGLSLGQQHRIVVEEARGLLPERVPWTAWGTSS